MSKMISYAWCSGILLLSLINLSKGVPISEATTGDDYYSDDYYNDDDYLNEHEKVVHVTPKFISESKDLMVNEGDTIKLPCLIDLLGQGFAVIWKKEPGSHIIAVEDQVINQKDTRIKLEKSNTGGGNTLVISLAEESDRGEYKCQISAYKPTILKHSVKIRVAPKIRPNPESGSVVVRAGEPATLSCDILKGSPAPEMTWKRKERKLPSGEEEIRGLSITFKETTRHHSGTYLCSADNGFGKPTTATITLSVHHKPVVETDQTYIHTRENDETEIVCSIHASPKAKVTWIKDGKSLNKDEGIISQRGNRHTLLLPGITQSTFGVYTCRAENELGSDEQTTAVSGKAGPANVKSGPEGLEENSFEMEWVSESRTNITAFKLQYRREDETDWKEIQVESTDNGDGYYSGQYVLDSLSSATRYAARISSKNDYGYSEFSPPFAFATKGAEPKQEPSIGGKASSLRSYPLFAILLISALRSLSLY